MELFIIKDKTIGELQDEFNSRFKFLKLGFFIDKNGDNRLTADEQIKNRNMRLGAISETTTEGHFTVSGSTTVKEIEELFRESYGLEVQVLRRSGENWLVTGKTDNWTLDEQNQRAEEMSKPVDAPEPGDYQEHE